MLVVGIFFFPNLVGNYLIRPAMSSVFPVLASAAELGQPISAWHGFIPELWMTIGVVVAGVFLYIFHRYWKVVYKLFPEKWTFNELYTFSLTQLEGRSTTITNGYMTGFLRDYMVYIFLFFIAAVGGMLFFTDAFSFDTSGNASISKYEWIISFVMMAAAIAILFAKSRLTAILLNGVLGFSIAAFFVVFRAPDLALTQLVVESVTTVLFLVCYYFLPEWKKEDAPRKTKNNNLIISVSVGAVFVLVGLAVQNGKLFETISGYFENAYELAGGRNIVNAILGDFRAFDTMLEVVVLLIAGIGVYTLIKLKARKEDETFED